ncbi:Ran-binding protein 3 [Cichlidogyrus casuarinus]|uniref:Ran-binding protein 3 n=1 Tax=Cichlidogyrus casuarinus TaxID=1844966 RepID=A0ABD2PYP8_9PLAT
MDNFEAHSENHSKVVEKEAQDASTITCQLKPSIFKAGFLSNKFSSPKTQTSEPEPIQTTENSHSIESNSNKPKVHLAPPNFSAVEEKSKLSSSNISSGFVFGQNISSKVVNSTDTSLKTETLFSAAPTSDSKECGNFFTQLAKACNPTESNFLKSDKSLSESAEETFKTKIASNFDLQKKVEVHTGEEDEITTHECSCRVYVMEDKRWNNLGSAYLHLNDPKNMSLQKSRLIARMAATLRVIINTQIYREMSIQLADPRSIRIGTVDPDSKLPKIFLLVLSTDSAESFYAKLVHRQINAPLSDKPTQSSTKEPQVSFRQSALSNTVKSLEANREIKSPKAGSKRPCEDSLEAPPAKPILAVSHPTSLIPPTSNSSQHVFGENIQNRVSNTCSLKGATNAMFNKNSESPNQLFTQLARRVCNKEENSQNTTNGDKKLEQEETLEESAARLQAEKDSKTTRLEAPDQSCTGEENEEMAIRTYCQVFFLNREKKTWECRGSVYLHVNDCIIDGVKKSRLVARVQKTHRLVVNSPIWKSMKVEMSNEKSLRCLIMNSGISDAAKEQQSSSQPNFEGCLLVFKNPNEAQILKEVLLERVNQAP